MYPTWSYYPRNTKPPAWVADVAAVVAEWAFVGEEVAAVVVERRQPGFVFERPDGAPPRRQFAVFFKLEHDVKVGLVHALVAEYDVAHVVHAMRTGGGT